MRHNCVCCDRWHQSWFLKEKRRQRWLQQCHAFSSMEVRRLATSAPLQLSQCYRELCAFMGDHGIGLCSYAASVRLAYLTFGFPFAGYMVFEQIRIQSQMQLQAFQILSFLFIEAAMFMNKQSMWGASFDFLIRMPVIGTHSLLGRITLQHSLDGIPAFQHVCRWALL